MEQHQEQYFIPLVTSEAGACLTLANWQEIGIQALAYSLDACLMKPGYALLHTLPNLRSFCAWNGIIVLKAILPLANTADLYKLRSRYDGSLIEISTEALVSLIIQLAPNLAILPAELLAYRADFPKTIRVFIPIKDYLLSSQPEGIGAYCFYEAGHSFPDFLAQFRELKPGSAYLSGNFDYWQAELLLEEGALWLESNRPASDARMGIVYGEEEVLNLLDKAMAEEQQPIAPNCLCPTCKQKLTRAYLHHLLQQTPLLCERFLIQHNVSNYFRKVLPRS